MKLINFFPLITLIFLIVTGDGWIYLNKASWTLDIFSINMIWIYASLCANWKIVIKKWNRQSLLTDFNKIFLNEYYCIVLASQTKVWEGFPHLMQILKQILRLTYERHAFPHWLQERIWQPASMQPFRDAIFLLLFSMPWFVKEVCLIYPVSLCQLLLLFTDCSWIYTVLGKWYSFILNTWSAHCSWDFHNIASTLVALTELVMKSHQCTLCGANTDRNICRWHWYTTQVWKIG